MSKKIVLYVVVVLFLCLVIPFYIHGFSPQAGYESLFGSAIMAYAFLFFLAAGFIYYFFFRRVQPKHSSLGKSSLYIVLGLAFIARIIIAPKIQGFSTDINCFKAWAAAAADHFTGFYNTGMFCDYPPLYIYVLFIIGKLMSIPGLDAYSTLLVKLPSILADIATAYLIYRLANKSPMKHLGVPLAAFYAFNPAVLLNSTLWGQVDSFFTLIILAALLLLSYGNLAFSSAMFTAAVLMKPQGIIFLPVLFYELVKRKKAKNFVTAFISALSTAVLVILPFSRDPLWIFNLFLKTASGYTYASLNAFNLFSLLGANLKNDSQILCIFSYNTWGLVLIALITVFTAFLYFKSRNGQVTFIAALLQLTGVFMLSSRMHERYLFPSIALCLIAFLYVKDRRLLPLSAAFSATVFINMHAVLFRMIRLNNPHIPPDDKVLLLVSLINVLLLAYLLKLSFDIVVRNNLIIVPGKHGLLNIGPIETGLADTESTSDGKTDFPAPGLKPDKTDIVLMLTMTLVYLLTSLINLGSLHVPETSWKPSKTEERFTVDLGREVQLSKIYYYCGLGDGSSAAGKYTVRYMDRAGEYKPYTSIDKKDLFIWKTVKTPDMRVRTLQFTVDEPGGTLNELAFFEKDSTQPLQGIKIMDRSIDPSDTGSVENLFDEQDRIDYKHSFLSGTIFDEVYHARTAYEFLHHIEPYEWTHPPLGKILISLGIAVFGMNPFGWRIIGTLFGAAMIPIMYLFGKKMFGQRFYAFCAAFLMMFDFMHYSLTRISTIDVHGTFFVLLMYYFMFDYYTVKSYKLGYQKSLKPLFWCGLFFGLGAASKWIALYAAGGLALLFFIQKFREYRDYHALGGSKSRRANWLKDFTPLYIRRTFLYCILFFVAIPSIIYALSYIPYMQVPGPGHGIDVIWRNQRDMFVYHSKTVLGATHPFTSSWWEWPLILKPLETYLGTDLPAGMSSSMTIMGNPVIWWTGIAAVLAIAGIALVKFKSKYAPVVLLILSLILIAFGGEPVSKTGVLLFAGTVLFMVITLDQRLAVVFTAIAFQYLPWVGVKRIAFIYHFFSVVPFMILAIVYIIKILIQRAPRMKYIVYAYLIVAAGMFVMFYPVLSGLEVSRQYVENYLLWFRGQWFF